MTDIEYQDDRVVQAQALWTHQFLGKTTIDAITDVLTAESQELEDVYNQLRARLDVDSQEGAQLDGLGVLVGQPRQGQLDDTYKLWIKARQRVNRSSGSPVDIYAVAKLILGDAVSMRLEQIPHGHVLHINEYVSQDPVSLQRLLQDASSATVPFYYSYVSGSYDRFTYGSGSTPTPSSPVGYDNGRFVDWLGPDQSPDHYARVREIFGHSLADAWDVRHAEISDSAVLRVRGEGLILTPHQDSISPDATLVKKAIAGVLLGSAKALTAGGIAITSAFEGANAWTVVTYLDVQDADGIFIATDPTVTVGVYAAIQSGELNLVTADGVGVSTFSSGPATVSTGLQCVIVSYDGAGSVQFWIAGTNQTDTDPHLTITGLQMYLWGVPPLALPDTPHYAQCVINRSISELEALAITEYYNRSFTDNAYY